MVLHRDKGEWLPHVVYKPIGHRPLIPEFLQAAIAHVWNRIQCHFCGHDDLLWHMGQRGYPDPPECIKCCAPLAGCTNPAAHVRTEVM